MVGVEVEMVVIKVVVEAILVAFLVMVIRRCMMTKIVSVAILLYPGFVGLTRGGKGIGDGAHVVK